jgi:phage baseplate assembly protein W
MTALYKDFNQYDLEKPFLTNIDVIFQGIDNILSTFFNTRLFNNGFGSILPEMPFEFADPDTVEVLESAIYTAISTWNPRVIFDLGRSKFTPVPDDNKIELDLWFKLKGEGAQKFNYTGELNAV